MFNLDKMKQAGSLMKQMNSLKKKIDKLETASESKDGNIVELFKEPQILRQ